MGHLIQGDITCFITKCNTPLEVTYCTTLINTVSSIWNLLSIICQNLAYVGFHVKDTNSMHLLHTNILHTLAILQ